MFQDFSPRHLNYVILSLKITSSSALLILLPYAFLFMWFWELLCVLFLLLPDLEQRATKGTVFARRKLWKLVFEMAEVH